MNYIRHLNTFFEYVRVDNRLTSCHVALYMALFHFWNLNRFISPVSIPRDDLMKLSAIGSKNTYLKTLKQLGDFGYIKYDPGTGKFFKSKIYMTILKVDEKSNDNRKYCPTIEPDTTPVTKTYCPNYGPDTVPNVTPHCPKYDPGTVPHLSPLIKLNLNINKERENTLEKNQNKNLKKNEGANMPPTVPNMGQNTLQIHKPSQQEIVSFFESNKYPALEANKFFLYYQATGWQTTGGKLIADWQAAAHKWMLNNFQNQKTKSNGTKNYLHTSDDQNYSEPF